MPTNFFNLPSDCLQIIYEYAGNERKNKKDCFKQIIYLGELFEATRERFCKFPKKEKLSKLFGEEIYYYFTVNGKRFMFVNGFKNLERLQLYSDPFAYFKNDYSKALPYLKTQYFLNFNPYWEDSSYFQPKPNAETMLEHIFASKDVKGFYQYISVRRFLILSLSEEFLSLCEMQFFERQKKISDGMILSEKYGTTELDQKNFNGEHHHEEDSEEEYSSEYSTDSEEDSEEEDSEEEDSEEEDF